MGWVCPSGGTESRLPRRSGCRYGRPRWRGAGRCLTSDGRMASYRGAAAGAWRGVVHYAGVRRRWTRRGACSEDGEVLRLHHDHRQSGGTSRVRNDRGGNRWRLSRRWGSGIMEVAVGLSWREPRHCRPINGQAPRLAARADAAERLARCCHELNKIDFDDYLEALARGGPSRKARCPHDRPCLGRPLAPRTALEAVRGRRCNTRAERDYIAPYSCRFCHGWHIGHPPKRNC